MKFIANIFKGLWATLNFSRRLLLNLIFLFIFIAIIISLFSGEDDVTIENNSALRLNLSGSLVEELTYREPVDAAFEDAIGDQDRPMEILIDDVIKVINKAAKDDRIQVMVLDLQSMHSSHLDKLRDVVNAVEQFKAAGKKVYAHGAYYTQAQYFLASAADEIALHPYGAIKMSGFGMYPLYFKDALDKLKVNQHIFRVGTYKSAVEPYIRNNMSDAAKESNLGWLNPLWDQYKSEVAQRRSFDVANFDETLAALENKMASANGDSAVYALSNSWVDKLMTSQEFTNKMIDEVGKNKSGKSYKQVSFKQYKATLPPKMLAENPITEKVAVIVARGQISDGKRKAGAIGGDSTAALLRKARFDDKVKAVVLRIDSGGGSMFASEIIRNEVLAIKESGKPIIASMGSVAASGGYWIAASANEIWASPSTITGSIGVFGTIMTFEKSLNSLGVYSDGVATTEIKGQSTVRGIDEKMANIIQMGVEDAYDKFISMVAQERNLTKSAVDEIAQGRVWLATQAKEFGLVDKLGSKADAIKAAAELANLQHYDVITIEQELTEQEKFMKQILGTSTAKMALQAVLPEQSVLLGNSLGSLSDVREQIESQAKMINQFNDPNNIYSICLTCEVTIN
ncbi:signal peptide peptidase SppA [Pseudoalteromonas sp. T1lg65]|uniref:signal peptide peptidase SppA n=1 Tax=Pseudoalteromonas sp. T1lg65 TaxID=2077101 RepID=UPI003F7B0F36